MLQISSAKIGYVIIRARELEAKVGRWDGAGDVPDADTILEDRAGDATGSELRQFIAAMNEDEQVSLVAVAWIGRGTFEPEELDEAMQTARDEASTPTEDYLLGIPQLADDLEAGMEALDLDPEEAEDDLMR